MRKKEFEQFTFKYNTTLSGYERLHRPCIRENLKTLPPLDIQAKNVPFLRVEILIINGRKIQGTSGSLVFLEETELFRPLSRTGWKLLSNTRTLRANRKNILRTGGLRRHAGSRLAKSFCLELLENRQWESSETLPLSRPITFFSLVLFSSPLFALFSPSRCREPHPATEISFAFNFSRGIRDKCQSRPSLSFFSHPLFLLSSYLPFPVPCQSLCLPRLLLRPLLFARARLVTRSSITRN